MRNFRARKNFLIKIIWFVVKSLCIKEIIVLWVASECSFLHITTTNYLWSLPNSIFHSISITIRYPLGLSKIYYQGFFVSFSSLINHTMYQHSQYALQCPVIYAFAFYYMYSHELFHKYIYISVDFVKSIYPLQSHFGQNTINNSSYIKICI